METIIKTRVKIFFSGLLIFLLSGCSTVPINYTKSLQQARVCCDKFSEVKYQKLEYGKDVSKQLGVENDKARNFREGKSYYMPVEFPPYEGAFEIQINSTPVGNNIFIPRIALLNKNHKIIKQISSSSFVFSNGKASHKFFINNDLGYRYMILYTAKADLGKSGKEIKDTSHLVPIYAGGYVFYYSHGSEKSNTITSAEGGELSVKVLKYAPKIVSGSQ